MYDALGTSSILLQVQNGVCIDIEDPAGRTALEIAIESDNKLSTEIIKWHMEQRLVNYSNVFNLPDIVSLKRP